jgi:hypothetical protein
VDPKWSSRRREWEDACEFVGVLEEPKDERIVRMDGSWEGSLAWVGFGVESRRLEGLDRRSNWDVKRDKVVDFPEPD